MNEFNHRTALNHQLRMDAEAASRERRAARARIIDRRINAAIRHHNHLIALDLSVAAVCVLALAVLTICII